MDNLLHKKIFVRYVNYKNYMRNYGRLGSRELREITTSKIEGVLVNYTEPNLYIDGGDEYGFIIIPRHFIIELYQRQD